MGTGIRLTDAAAGCIRRQARFRGIFTEDGGLGRTAMPPCAAAAQEELRFLGEAAEAGYDGSQEEALAGEVEEYTGAGHAVPLSSGHAALQLALRLAAERLYGSSSQVRTPDGLGRGGALLGKKVFCPDFASPEAADAVLSEGGEPVFLDISDEGWGMDPEVLEIAFNLYPDTRIVILCHPYGYPGQAAEVKRICGEHGAVLIEDASDAFGARNRDGEGRMRHAGTAGDYGVLDFGPGRLLSGSSGGMLLTEDAYSAEKAAYWASGARGDAPWILHEEMGCGCRMGDAAAAVLRGRLRGIGAALEGKKGIYGRYLDGLGDGPLEMAPAAEGAEPSCWMSCAVCEGGFRFRETRSEREYTYAPQHGAASPMEICEALTAFGAECAPVYKPLSTQPLFRGFDQVTLDGSRRRYRHFAQDGFLVRCNLAEDLFQGGLCLPSGIWMTEEEQGKVIEVIRACFD